MRASSRLVKSRFEKHLHASIVASHVVNRARDACCSQSLTGSGWFKVASDALQTCLGRHEIHQSQLRRAVHGRGDASKPQRTTKAGIQRLPLMCKIKNTVKVEKTQAWSSQENGTPNSVQKASNDNPTYLWKRAPKMVQQDKKSKRTAKRLS